MSTPVLPLSPAIRHGDTLYLSGQIAFDGAGRLVGEDVAGQTRQVIANIETVLGTYELQLSDIFKATIWLTDRSDFSAFNAVYSEYFEAGAFPVRSTVVSDLAIEGAKIEIEVMARLS
ncbi:MAG: RidA family protein [Pseudomonadota bacterium]